MKAIVTKYVADKRVKIILHELEKLDKNMIKILDVGCGNQYITEIIRSKGYDIIGIDKCSSKNCKWMKRDPDKTMDATNMTFDDNSFDVIIALEIIEHCDCVPEIKRVLKPGGFFFCSTPMPYTDWVRQILVLLRLLEAQDFEAHDHLVSLPTIPMKLLNYKKMFLFTSQFGIFTK